MAHTINGLAIRDGCRLSILPGFQNPPAGGGQTGSTPPTLVPTHFPRDTSGILDPPWDPPPPPRETFTSVLFPQGIGGTGATAGGLSVTTGGPQGPITGGPVGPTATAPTGPPAGPPAGPTATAPTGPTGPTTGGQPAGPTATAPTGPTGPTGPTTGGQVPGPTATAPTGPPLQYRCQELRYICPEDLELPVSQQRIRSVYRTCIPATPGVGSGLVASGVSNPSPGVTEAFVVVMGDLKTQQECAQACVPAQSVYSVNCGPLGSGLTGSTVSVGGSEAIEAIEAQSYVGEILSKVNSTQKTQSTNNANKISVDEALLPQTQSSLIKNLYPSFIYDPQKNFFSVPVTEKIISMSNNKYTNIFRDFVAEEVGYLLRYQNENTRDWEETPIQNLTDPKLIFSLSKNIVEAFNNIRDITGKVIGLSSFLEVIRKHLVTGTLNEFNPDYYLRSYELQKSRKFVDFNKSVSKSSNELFSLLYLRDPEFGLTTPRSDWDKEIQMGRFRFLNEDLEVALSIQKENGEITTLDTPNEGIPISFLTPKSASTPANMGSPNLLNIGDGGGYYFNSMLLDTTEQPVATLNLASSTFYAPASVRSSLLEVMDWDFQYKITSKSLENKNEFVSGDLGVSSLEPLYFAIDLSSVSSYSFNRGMVETYSSTYSIMTDTSAIQKHINNNALSIPEVYLDYRDPIYRYILDSSSFSMESSDISNRGFESNPTLLRGDNFVKNVPFAFIIIPSRGSNFNPFNGRSRVTSFSDIVEREIVLRPSINNRISEDKKTNFESYNLYNEDGSKRVGFNEKENIHSFGYRYTPSSYYNSFYSDGSIATSSSPVSSYGASYLVKDVLDFIKDEYNPTSLVWFDVFSRMPLSRMGELIYDLPAGFMTSLQNGYRHGIRMKNAQKSSSNPVTLLAEDSKTVVKSSNRPLRKVIPG